MIAVGSTRYSGSRASYSDTGPGIEIMAPAGEDLAMVAPGIRDGALSSSFVYDPDTGETTYSAYWATGTSFAAPQVSGLAALLVALGVHDPEGLRFVLDQTAADLGSHGFDEDSGNGLVDALQAHLGVGFNR